MTTEQNKISKKTKLKGKNVSGAELLGTLEAQYNAQHGRFLRALQATKVRRRSLFLRKQAGNLERLGVLRDRIVLVRQNLPAGNA